MGLAESKKYTLKISQQSVNGLGINIQANISSVMMVVTNWSLEEIREMCLAYNRYSNGNPFLNRFIFKKIIHFSNTLASEIFNAFSKGKKYISFYQFVSAVVLTSYNTYKRKLQFLYLIFNFMHEQTLRMKHFILMYESVVFGYCRITDQTPPTYKKLKQYLLEQYLKSDAYEILERGFEFRKLIEEVEVSLKIMELFNRFQGIVDGVKQKPFVFMLNGLTKYDKDQQAKIFSVIKKAYQQNDYSDAKNHETKKLERLSLRKISCLNAIQQDKLQILENTKTYRIKNRIFSLKNNSILGNTNYNSPNSESLDKKFASTLNLQKLKNQQSMALQIFKSPQKVFRSHSSVLNLSSKQKFKQVPKKSVTNQFNSKSQNILRKPSQTLLLNGKAYTKAAFFQTIQYFNSLSNNKEEIKIKQFFKTFEKKSFMRKQLSSIFNYFDANKNGLITFQQFIKASYPRISKNLVQRLKLWNLEYKSIYQADKMVVKRQKKDKCVELPRETEIRMNELFRSFGGEKGFINFEDLRNAWKNGFSIQECQDIVKQFGDGEGKIFIEQFAKLLLPQGFVIEGKQWEYKK